MAKVTNATKRTRRMFSAEFKQEAVRRMAERRAHGVSVQQIGRAVGGRVSWAGPVAD